MQELVGQLSLLDIPDISIIRNTVLNVAKKTEEVDYLKKGEKILELLRSKGEKSSFSKNDFWEMFNFATYNTKSPYDKVDYVLKQIRNRLIRPLFDEIKEKGVEVLDGLFLGVLSENLLTPVVAGSYEDRLLGAFFYRNSSKYAGGLEFYLSGNKKKVYIPYGKKANFKSNLHMRECYLKSSRSQRRICADAGIFFAEPVLCFQLRKKVLEKIKNESAEECESYWYLKKQQVGRIESYVEDNKIRILKSAYELSIIRDFLQENISYEIEIVENDVYEKMEWKEQRKLKCMTEGEFRYLFFINEEVPERLVHTFFSYNNFGTCGMTSDEITTIFEYIFKEYVEDRSYDAYEKELRAAYAKSFMTKKTVSQKIVKAMEKSEFNKFFGYVEYDTEVELDKMKEIAREWTALSNYMHFELKSDVSLRFRKLGQHKAAGLFYPYLKCICVDVHNPSSMLHEYMHMLDYENDSASRKISFSGVRKSYETFLRKQMESNKELKKKLSGSGKYNISYYLQATEIFARCGELYVTRCLGVDNSVAKPEWGFAYPDDEDFLEEVRVYYDNFFEMDSEKYRLKEAI